jgi:3-isopropylmalate/(R)-2-methylmalate dehydratase large subunit
MRRPGGKAVTAPQSLFDKVWDAHRVTALGGGLDLLYVDRHLLHDLSGPGSLAALDQRELPVRRPDLTFATPDHGVSTAPGRDESTSPIGARLVPALRARCRARGIRLFDLDDAEQGIVHVVGPEQGLTLPGTTLLCGDSHTCTHGGLGALSWGIGSSEITHVLATQTVVEERPRTLRIRLEGRPAEDVEAKDLILALIARLGAAAGSGFAIEYAGAAVRALGVEARMTLCNLSIEMGAKIGIVAPDDATFEYLAGRPFAPQGRAFDAAVRDWRLLPSDDEARFDREVSLDVADIRPQITWGTSPAHSIAVDGRVPHLEEAPDAGTRGAWQDALRYMDLEPGAPIAGVPIQRVFVGSCTNGRLSDLRAAADVLRGRRVAEGVVAWVVPGSRSVVREAEAVGLDRIFRKAGFEWREPGCSVCSAANGEFVPPGHRCVSTSNRNFVGRQGPGARTHLASPRLAAACAVAGRIVDPRDLGEG